MIQNCCTRETSAAGEENTLTCRARQRDPEAFAELMRRTSGIAHRLALHVVRDPDVAEEGVQNGFWKAWERISTFEGKSRFTTWVNRIVLNECLLLLRSRARRRTVPLEASPEYGRPLDLPDRRESPEARLASEEVRALLGQEVRRLPLLFRRVLTLHYYDQLGLPELAEQLQITVPAAKSRLRRARRELHARLQMHGGALWRK